MTMTPVTVPSVNRKLGTTTLKLDLPKGNIYSSTKPCPIKVDDTAPSETMRANEIAIETAKTGKVAVVVSVMCSFSGKRCKLRRSANRRNEKPSCQKAENANFLEENSRRLRNLSQKMRKDHITKKLASKLKKLELNCT
jgi:hypothetical protein